MVVAIVERVEGEEVQAPGERRELVEPTFHSLVSHPRSLDRLSPSTSLLSFLNSLA